MLATECCNLPLRLFVSFLPFTNFCSGMANVLSTLKLSFLHSFFFFFYFIFLSCFLFSYSDGTHSGPERSKTVIQVEQGMTCSLSATISFQKPFYMLSLCFILLSLLLEKLVRGINCCTMSTLCFCL